MHLQKHIDAYQPAQSAQAGLRRKFLLRRSRNLEVPSSIPGSGCQVWDFFIGPHIRREYWCSSQEAESREISMSCKNLFLNRCKINCLKKINPRDSVT